MPFWQDSLDMSYSKVYWEISQKWNQNYIYGLCIVSEIYPFQCISAPIVAVSHNGVPLSQDKAALDISFLHQSTIQQPSCQLLILTHIPHNLEKFSWLNIHIMKRKSHKKHFFITGLLCKCFTRLVLHVSVQIHMQLKKSICHELKPTDKLMVDHSVK